ncbi:Hom-end-associated Hint [compost metagenome]
MRIVYGCLAENTRILMQDGGEKSISDLAIGEYVLSRNNIPLRIEAITNGLERNFIEITTQNSKGKIRTITSSLGHPFITSAGVVIARELNHTSKLITLEGEYEIISIEQQQGELKVYNLQLTAEAPVDKGLYDDNTLYANGILVGDLQMQRIYEDEYYQRPVNILSKLPKEWHQDYQNHLNAAGK